MMTPRRDSALTRPLRMESLEQRLCMTLTVYFDADVAGLLHVEGTREDDTILMQDLGLGKVTITDGTSGERFENEGVAKLVVHAGEGNDVIRFEHRGDGNVAELDILADAGDDTVAIGLLLPAVQKVRDAAARIHVDLGEGNNRLQVNSHGIDTIDLDVTAGKGTDEILIGLLLPAVQKVRDAAARSQIDLFVDAGGGDDTVGLLLPAVQKVRDAAARMEIHLGDGNNELNVHGGGLGELDLDVTAGEGTDEILIGMLLPAVQKVRDAAGAAPVNLSIDSGSGDDSVLIGLLLPAVQKVRDAAASIPVDVAVRLGDGNNKLKLNANGLDDLGLDITAGDGDDAILIGLLLPAVQKVRDAAARMDAHLGGGNNRLQLHSAGISQLDLDITAEGGDDEILIGMLLPAVQKVRDAAARSASVSVQLGDGADSLQLRTLGFETDEVFTQIGEDVEVVRLHLGKPIDKAR